MEDIHITINYKGIALDEQVKNWKDLYPEYDKIYGPYINNKNRKFVILFKSRKKKKTISYPKLLMECYLGKRLSEDETVDHINRDYTDDSISNLQVLVRSEHAKLDVKRLIIKDVECVMCGRIFTQSIGQRNQRSSKIAGPFCSKRCSGRYGKIVQETGETMDRTPYTPEYYMLSKIKPAEMLPDSTSG